LSKSGFSLQDLQMEVDRIRVTEPDRGLQSSVFDHFSEFLHLSGFDQTFRSFDDVDIEQLKEPRVNEIQACEKSLGCRNTVVITLKRTLAVILRECSRLAEAEAVLAATISSIDDMMVSLKVHMDIAMVYKLQGRTKLSAEKIADVLAGLQATIGSEHSFTLSAESALARVWGELGKLQEAEQLLESVISRKQAKFGSGHPSTLDTASGLVVVYHDQGRLTEAEDLQSSILETRKGILGDDHALTWTSRLNLAAIYSKQNRLKEAEAIELQALAFRNDRFGPKHHLTLTALSNLAVTYQLQKRIAEERLVLDQVVAGRIEVLGPQHPHTLNSIQALANNHIKQKLPHQAEPLLQKLVDAKTESSSYGSSHPSTLASRNSLAWAYFDQGKLDEASSMQIATVEEGAKVLGTSHQAVLRCKRHYGMMCRLAGRLQESRQVLQEVWEVQVQKLGISNSEAQNSARDLTELEKLIEQSAME